MIPLVHLFQTDRYKYAYDVNSNDIVRLSDLAFDVLLLLTSGLSKNDVLKALQGQYAHEELLATMGELERLQSERRLFLDKRPKRIAYLPCDYIWQQMYDFYIEQITLELTQRCNLRCKYCVYSDMYPENRHHSDQDMPWDIAKAGLDYILAHGGQEANPYVGRAEPTRDFAVGLYGGEPLLRLDLIEECLSYMKQQKGEGRKCSFTLSTNGTLLDLDTVKFLIDNDVSLSISLDGPQHVHDKFRCYPDGRGSHDRVIRSLEHIQRYTAAQSRTTPYIGLVNTIIAGGCEWAEIWDYFSSMEPLLHTRHAQFQINVNGITGGLSRWNKTHSDEPLEPATGYEDLRKAYEEACLKGVYKKQNGPPSWRMQLLSHLVMRQFYFDVYNRTLFQPDDFFELFDFLHPGSICLPGKRRPYVLADGTVLPCERVPTNDPYFIIGNVKQGVKVKQAQRLVNDFTNPTIQDCKNCWNVRMCSVGCIANIVKNGRVDAQLKRERCALARDSTHEHLVGMCTLLEKDPTALDHYNDVSIS